MSLRLTLNKLVIDVHIFERYSGGKSDISSSKTGKSNESATQTAAAASRASRGILPLPSISMHLALELHSTHFVVTDAREEQGA